MLVRAERRGREGLLGVVPVEGDAAEQLLGLAPWEMTPGTRVNSRHASSKPPVLSASRAAESAVAQALHGGEEQRRRAAARAEGSAS